MKHYTHQWFPCNSNGVHHVSCLTIFWCITCICTPYVSWTHIHNYLENDVIPIVQILQHLLPLLKFHIPQKSLHPKQQHHWFSITTFWPHIKQQTRVESHNKFVAIKRTIQKYGKCLSDPNLFWEIKIAIYYNNSKLKWSLDPHIQNTNQWNSTFPKS